MRAQALIGFALGALVGALCMWTFGPREEVLPGGAPPAFDPLHERAAGDPSALLEGDGGALVAQLRADLASAQARIEELEASRSKVVVTRDRTGVHTSGSPQKRAKPMPKGLVMLAERMGVQSEPLELAWAVRTGQVEDRAAAIAKLKALGEQGLLALAALAVGPGTGHTMLPRLMGEMKVLDGSEVLMRLIDEHERPSLLVAALAEYDTPRVRDFLVDHLTKQEKDPGAYWTAATTLGRLKEPRGAEFLDVEVIIQPRWSGVRGHILTALGQMGGAHAVQRLNEYLSLEHADRVGTAAGALSQLDPDGARGHARRILESARAPFLTSGDRRALEALLKDDEER
jgi:hypothetical protein